MFRKIFHTVKTYQNTQSQVETSHVQVNYEWLKEIYIIWVGLGFLFFYLGPHIRGVLMLILSTMYSENWEVLFTLCFRNQIIHLMF